MITIEQGSGRRVAGGRPLLALTALAVLWAGTAIPRATAAPQASVRSLGMGGVRSTVCSGLCGARANPAALAWSDNPGTSVELFSTSARIANNGIGLDLYNRTTGATLDDAHKSEILRAIPASGLDTDFEAGASALGVQVGRLAFGIDATARGFSRLPHDVFSLILMGNATLDSIDFSDAEAEAYSVAAARISTAVTLGHAPWGPLHLGVSAAYLRGIAYARLERLEGELVTASEGVRGQALAELTTAGTGSGFGFDLALGTEIGARWRGAMVLHNAFAQVYFDQDVEHRRFSASLDTLDVATLQEIQDTSELYSSADSVSAGRPFTVDLPRQLDLGVSRVGDQSVISLEWQQGFARRAGTTITPRVAVGAEWSGWAFLPLRAGFSVGGLSGRSASVGLGLRLAAFRLDLAAATIGRWWPGDPRGIGLAVGSGLAF